MTKLANPTLPAIPSRSLTALMWRRFLRHRVAVWSGVLLLLLAALALAAPLFEMLLGVEHWKTDLLQRLQPPSLAHPLGTDDVGRDFLLRLLYGGRVSLFVGLVAALASMVIGTAVGLAAGYYRGWLDAALMRTTDAVIALPLLPLLIVLAAVDPAEFGLPDDLVQSENFSIWRVAVIIALVGWTRVARLVRGATLSMREREFIMAAVAQGARSFRIMTAHILPNVVSPVIVATTLSIGGIILFESVLSFLGLGIQPPNASWGNMLTNAQELVWESPRLVFWPGMLIFVTVIAFNFLGDGLNDAFDPRTVERQ